MCSSKKTYPTRETTVRVLAQIRHRAETNTFDDFCQAKRGYWCDVHGGWHLTKQDLKRRPVSSDVLPGDY